MSMLGHYASFKKGEHPDNNQHDIVGLFDRYQCSPKGAIHVGAHYCPEMPCYSKLFYDKVLWIEANPETYFNNAKPIAEQNAQRIYNFAAYDEDNLELTLYIPERDDISSLFLSEEFPHVRTTQVKTKKLDTLITEEKINMDDFDFLNIDAEGAELKVLQGFENNLDRINYLFIEVSIGERFRDSGATFEMLHNYLTNCGFEITEISDSIRTLGWGDAFYRRG